MGDKMVAVPGLTLFVKLDKAYGDKEDGFKELATLAHPVKNFLVGEIGVQEYGDKENDDVRENLGIPEDKMPAYILFKGSKDSRTQFEGFSDPSSSKPHDWDDEEDGEWEPPVLSDPTVENLALWLRRNGVKMPSIGTIYELDEIAKRFMKEGQKDADVAEAKKLATTEHVNDRKAAIYVRTMDKVKAKGVGYVTTEIARVKKLLDGKITDEKKSELIEKTRILNVFAE